MALIILAQFIKVISHYKKIGYNINVLQQTACLVVICLIWFFTSHQQSFSYKGTGIPGLNQY